MINKNTKARLAAEAKAEAGVSANGSQLLIWNVPQETKKEFKVACIEAEVSMRDVIIALMADFVDRRTPPKGSELYKLLNPAKATVA